MKKNKRPLPHLLYEIGTEEIPSTYLAPALASAQKHAAALLEECGYSFENLETCGTPRRLVVFARHILKKEALMEERLGPSKEQCYQNGERTAALNGFLKSVGKKESDLVWKETPRGVRAAVQIQKESKPLRYFFETLPSRIEFPKLMRWEPSGFSFVRPIRWLVGFLGTECQRFEVASLPSQRASRGHRFLADRPINIVKADLDQFKTVLRRRHVVLDEKERLAMIRRFLKKARRFDEELAQQAANLLEEPFPVEGSFNADYLSLPAEVLSTCMGKHQRIFACYDGKGKLTNRFIAFINGRRRDISVIARHYANVLESRLEDAKFFYYEDVKTTLESKAGKLSNLIFLGHLGSYAEKAKRLQALSEYLADGIRGEGRDLGDLKRKVAQAAGLCKVDLMSHLVYEFPELQGFAGSEYARRDGLPEEVSRAIYEHYVPKNLAEGFDEVRASVSLPGAIVGLADRLDLLVGAFGIGIEPSGSQDPYGLRRAAGGVVKLLRAFPIHVSLDGLIRRTYELYEGRLNVDVSALSAKLLIFFKERLFFELELKPGTREYELLEAVMASYSDEVADVYDRFEQLRKLYAEDLDAFVRASKIVERTFNILKGAKGKAASIPDSVDPALFREGMEKVLHDVLCGKEETLRELAGRREYAACAKLYGGSFFNPIQDFFSQVMVNVDEEAVRFNRLALMKKINRLMTESVADLACMTTL